MRLSCIKNVFEKPIFNFYGDIDQRIEEKSFEAQNEIINSIKPNIFNISVNYRNAKQITEYINANIHKNMDSIGVDGSVSDLKLHECKFEIKDRTAVIVKNIDLAKNVLKNYISADTIVSINDIDDEIDKKITLLNVVDCKGIEYDTVYVFDYDMTDNEKYVAYTRAMDCLVVIKDDLEEMKRHFEEITQNKSIQKDKQEVLSESPAQNESDSDAQSLVEDEFYNTIYMEALKHISSNKVSVLKHSISLLESIKNVKDVSSKIEAFKSRIFLIEIEQEEQKEMYRSQKLCQYCGGKFKGHIKKVCSKCGKEKNY